MCNKALFFFILFFSSKLFSFEIIERRQPQMDREGVYYFLVNLFGPSSKTMLKKNILLRPSLWGGPCDPYKQIYRKVENKIRIEDEESQCPLGDANSKLSFYVERNILTVALLDKTCKDLVSKKETINFFLERLNVKYRSEENSIKIYHAFFPGGKINTKWLELAKREKNINTIILSLCRTPSWQLL